MKKKGFTLIELLAVIVILAIIALILVPIVSNIVESARKTSFKESVNGIIDSTNNYLHDYILKHNNELNDYPVVFTCDGTSCKTTDNDVLTFKGNVPKSGNIIIQRDGVLAEYITDGKYCTYGYKWNLVVEDNCGEVDVTNPTISGVQNGKSVTLTMIDNESGIDSYCVTNANSTEGCNWVVPSNASNEAYEIPNAGTWYFFVKDKKGNISNSINYTTTGNDYCAYVPNQVLYESGTVGAGTYTVPAGCTGTYKLEVWGASGASSGGSGGRGGYSSGNRILNGNDTLYLVVGGGGSGMSGGYNGGGRGSGRCASQADYKDGGGGGGATHIAINEDLGELKNYASATESIVIVAGGGGGGSYIDGNFGGGAGGGTTGVNGTGRSISVAGATQTTGYAIGLGQNGAGCISNSWGESGRGGGGGGYYGGYASQTGAYGIAGGGGGSGYIGGVTDGQTLNGNTVMPTHDGTSTMTGNGGNGYVKVTFISLN